MKLLSAFVGSFIASTCFAKVYEYPHYDAIAKTKHNLSGLYKAYRLDNGLDVVIHRHEDKTMPMKVSMAVGVGSTCVSKKNPVLTQPTGGLAHLVEHCLFYANARFPTPFEMDKFISANNGYQNAATHSKYTQYEMQLGNKHHDGLTRFAHMFISPIFTAESVKAECEIIHNEWLTKEHMTPLNSVRYSQLLMSNEQPAKLFSCGNRETLTGNILEQVQLFWKTHYTADNMKLAISVYKDIKNLDELVFNLFSQIPTSDKKAPTVLPSPIPFWSKESSYKYLQAYSKERRRNRIHFYWNIHCDGGAICDDSLTMITSFIKKSSLNFKYSTRNFLANHGNVSYDEYLLEVSFDLRSAELSRVSALRKQIIEDLKNEAKHRMPVYKQSSVKLNSPNDKSVALSKAMLLDSIFYAPFRMYSHCVVNGESLSLLKKHLDFVINETPRIVVAYKSSLLKNVKKESLQFDPFYGIYYQYADLPKSNSALGIEEKKSPEDSSIDLTIEHDAIPETHRFLRGVFVEMLLISLKENNITCRHILKDNKITLVVSLPDAKSWEQTMKSVMESFTSPSLHSKETFEKAKMRWTSEIKSLLASQKKSGDVAKDYAGILTSTTSYNEISLLLSDPNPDSVSFNDVAVVGRILRQISSMNVSSFIAQKDILILDNKLIKERVTQMWNSGLTAKYSATYIQPAARQTFIYVPTSISTSDSATMILFPLKGAPTYVASLFEKILYPFFYLRLRTDMQVTYTPTVRRDKNNEFYITAQSFSTPEIMQGIITNLIKEIPSYITNMQNLEWNDLLLAANIGRMNHDIMTSDRSRGKNAFIDLVKKYLFEDSPLSSRLIIQLWTQNQYLVRAKYLANLERTASPTTKLIYTIRDYPRSAKIPEEFKYDDSLLKGFEVVEREFVSAAEPEVPAPATGFLGGLWSRIWGAPAAPAA